jgi:ribosomal subunit interface protein
MISNLQINGVHADVDNDLHKYITKKLGNLDKYIPRNSRESAHLEVKIKEVSAKDKRTHTCEVIMHLPHETFTTKESTMNMYAAVDIVEAKLKNHIKKYKGTHTSPKFRYRVVAKLRGRTNS